MEFLNFLIVNCQWSIVNGFGGRIAADGPKPSSMSAVTIE